MLSHSSGSPFLAGNGVLVAELGDTADTVLIGPVGAETVRITINNDAHEYARSSVLGISVSAGGGNDRVEVSSALDIPAVLTGGAGNDTLLGGAAADLLDGGPDADSLVGDDGDDVLVAEPLDSLDGGPGIDSLTLLINGTDGPDSIRIENIDETTTRVTINGSTYNYVRYEFTAAEIAAGAGNDLVELTADVQVNAQISGDAGDDTLIGGAGIDSLDGGAGADSLVAGAGDDSIVAEHTESIDSGAGNDSLTLLVTGTDSPDVIQLQNLDGTIVRLTSNGTFFDFLRSELRVVDIQAGGGNDSVAVGADVEFIVGIAGGDGDDTLTGGPNADVIEGGLGNDSLTGGAGGDTLNGFDGFDTIDGGSGDDLIDGGSEDDSLLGSDGSDTIWGNTGADTVLGGNDNDSLDGGLPEGYPTDLIDGADSVLGGVGNDTMSGAAGADTLDGEAGDDVLSGGLDADSLIGGDGADKITGGSESDTLLGGAGDDCLDGGLGVDSIDGGLDFNTLLVVGSENADTITAALDPMGNMTVTVGSESDTASLIEYVEVSGLGGHDSITIDELLNVDVSLDGGDGDDTLLGGHGEDILTGGAGNDSLNGRAGFDTFRFLGTELADAIALSVDASGRVQLQLGTEIDTADAVQEVFVNAAGGNDSVAVSFDPLAPALSLWLEGRGGDDTLVGGPGPDFLYGGGGIDSLDGGGGDDTLYGGSGDDSLTGGEGNDYVLGTTGDDSILGGPGNDTLLGGDGFDTILGEDGDDSIDGGNDSDSIDGGAGLDTIVGGGGDDTIDGQVGPDSIYGGLGNDVISGGDGNDTLGSDQGNDVFYGGAGDDQISGGADDDLLDGGEGDDVLDGGAGNDRLIGGSRSTPQGQRSGCDNDTLRGGGEDDVMDGGRGRDLLDGGAGTNDLTADLGRDTIVPGPGINRIQHIRKTDRGCGGVIRSARGVRAPLRGRFLMDLIRDMRRAADDRSPFGSQNSAHQTGRRPAPPPTAIASHEDDETTGRANLALATTTSVSTVPSAQSLTYTLTVTNAGPNKARHVVIYDTFAENVAVMSLAATQANGDPATCELEITNDLVCELGKIKDNPTDAAIVTTEVVVDAEPGNVSNSGVVTSTARDPVPANNTQVVNNSVTQALENVRVTATVPVATEEGTVRGRFTFSRDVAPNSLAVTFAVSGMAEAGDYASIGTSVTIPANQCCISIDVVGNEDSDVDAEIVIVAVQNGNGYVYSSPSQATVSITDNDVPKPVVTIAVSDGSASEAGLDTGRLTVTRTGNTSTSLAVSYTVRTGGFFDATAGSDYNTLSGNVTIPIGSSSAEIVVTPRPDPYYETLEYVTVDLQPGTNYDLGSPITADVTITSDDAAPDTVTVTTLKPDAYEQGRETGSFELHRNNFAVDLTVSFTVSGTATNGVDYDAIGTSVVIPSGSTSKTVTVIPVDDTVPNEGDETVVLTVNQGAGYTVGSPSNATVTIHDNDCSAVRARRISSSHGSQFWEGETVTYTAVLAPAGALPAGTTFVWEFRKLTGAMRGARSYGNWEPAPGQQVGNRLIVREDIPKTGQYRVTVKSCAVTSYALLSVDVKAAYPVNFRALPDGTMVDGVVYNRNVQNHLDIIYTWDSSSTRIPDLDGVQLREFVWYTVAGLVSGPWRHEFKNPPFLYADQDGFVAPTPPVPADQLHQVIVPGGQAESRPVFIDHHGNGMILDLRGGGTETAKQRYEYYIADRFEVGPPPQGQAWIPFVWRQIDYRVVRQAANRWEYSIVKQPDGRIDVVLNVPDGSRVDLGNVPGH